MLIAAITFFASLSGILILFAIKHWETRAERTFAPQARIRADERALEFKELLGRSRGELEKLPPAFVRLLWFLIHESALAIARFGRFLERRAYHFADFISHKRGFRRTETNSEFLRHMSGYKNRLDTTEGDGHNS
jgi:hypothetical protein